jgi:hypothetical protein
MTNTNETEGCQCGEWSGVRCTGTLDADAVTVVFMPANLRDSHVTGRNRGAYPHNGAVRIRVHPRCAALMIESEGDWCALVEGL